MAAPQNIIAVVFDFDDTLTDDSTTELLRRHEVDENDFWKKKWKRLVNDGWNPASAYLKLLLDEVGDGKPLDKLTNRYLRTFGSTLKMYKGLPTLFKGLKDIAAKHLLSRPTVEFYIISGGLEEIIKGSKIAKYFSGIWGCRLAEEGGMVRHVIETVTFTEKTKYLFLINKGFTDHRDPYAANKQRDPKDRRIPFSNIIYVGDGLTDIPCFSLVERLGGSGKTFGVFDPKKKDPKTAVQNLLVPKRVGTLNSPRYGPKDDLGALLRAAVKMICMELDLRAQGPLTSQP